MKAFFDVAALSFAIPFIWMLDILPRKAAIAVARAFLGVLFTFFPRFRGVALRNLQAVFPEKDAAEHQRIFKASYTVLAKNLVSFAGIPRLTEEYVKATMNWEEPVALFDEAKRKSGGIGVIIATGHFGSFEGIVARESVMHEPVSILARGFGLPRLDAWWNHRRGSHGNNVFSRRGGYRELVGYLKEGRNVGILVDQNVKRNHATFVPFLGITAATTKSVGLAVLQTGARVVFALSYEKDNGDYHVLSEEIAMPEEGSNDERIDGLMINLHSAFDAAIRAHPEQWFWVHRRFKTRPPGEPENFYD